MAIRMAQVNVTCEYCNGGVQFCCSDCFASMCGGCIGTHMSITGNDEHVVIKYSKKKSLDVMNVCKLHKLQKFEFYCNQCLEPVCSKCIIGPHKSHPMDELESATHLKQIEIEKDTFELETTLKSHYEEKLSQADEQKSNRRIKYDTINQIVEKQGTTLKREIDEVIKEYKRKSDVMKNNESAELEEYKLKLKELLDALRERIRKNKELLDSGDGHEISCYTSENERFRLLPELPQFTDPEFEPCTIQRQSLSELIGKLKETCEGENSLNTRTLLVAIHSLRSNEEHCLSFSKGDYFEVDSNNSFKEEDEWCYVKHLSTGESGYVPNNHVKRYTEEEPSEDHTDTQQPPWWFIGSKDGAENQLLISDLRNGSFLVRESTDGTCYFLSIRLTEETAKTASVRHYRVCKKDGEVFVPSRQHFPSLDDMIKHYQTTKDDLCCQLTDPYSIMLQRTTVSQQEISRKDIKIGKHLASGRFGNIYSGKLPTSKSVAVKACDMDDKKNNEEFLKQADNMKALRHPRILQLYGLCTQSNPKLIVTELMEIGNLLLYLRKDKGTTLSFDEITNMASHIAEGMVFIESKGYVHRNLRAGNILLGMDYTVKISGLGLAMPVATENEDTNKGVYNKKTLKWDALEVITSGRYSSKSDVWSFGVLLFELVTFGKQPYEGMNDKDIIAYLKRGCRIQKPSKCPDDVYDTMMKCWNKEDFNRYSFEYLFSYFNNYSVSCERAYAEIKD